jgi:hypothetical protein
LVIEGLKVELKTEELRAHLETRAQHHEKREAEFAAEVKRVGDAMEGMGPGHSTMGEGLKGAAKRHRDEHASKATFFALLARHLVEGEVYRLDDSDLSRLEFLSRS